MGNSCGCVRLASIAESPNDTARLDLAEVPQKHWLVPGEHASGLNNSILFLDLRRKLRQKRKQSQKESAA
jgi:hypothetical protein